MPQGVCRGSRMMIGVVPPRTTTKARLSNALGGMRERGAEDRSEYETLWQRCRKTVEGEGDQGPPDGWCYGGEHTVIQSWILVSTFSERKNLGGRIVEKRENTILRQMRLARAPTCIQRPRTWRKVGPVERKRMVTARKSSRSIHPHPHHRSRSAITGSPD